MPYTDQEQDNLRVVRNALAAAATDFSRFGEAIFAHDIAWTTTGYGHVARTFRASTT